MKKKIVLFVAVFLIFCLAGCTTLPETYDEEPLSNEEVTDCEEESVADPFFPLLASDEEHNVFLYGINPSGVVLYINGEGHFYDIDYNISPKLPEIGVGDFKYGSKNDIGIILPSESGEEMLIITNGKYNDEYIYKVDESQIDFYASQAVSFVYQNETITFSFGDNSHIFDISDCFENLNFGGVSYCENIKYEFCNGKIYVNIIPAVKNIVDEDAYETVAAPVTVRAELIFDGTYISLADFTVKGLTENIYG